MQPGPPSPAEVLAHGTEPPVGAATSLRRGRLTLALVAALGLVAGGLVMDRYTALTDERERRSTVALVARVQDLSPAVGATEALTLYARLTNAGPLDVTVLSVAVDGRGVRSLPQDMRPVPVPASGAATVSVGLEPACPLAGAPQWRVRLGLRTDDGAARTRLLALEDDRGVVRETVTGLCSEPTSDESLGVFLSTAGPGVTIGSGQTAVYRAQLSLEEHGPATDLAITELRARTPALAAALSSGTGRPLTVDWRVRDCDQARSLRADDYTMTAVGRLDRGSGRAVSTNAYLDADLLVRLAGFVGRVCG